AEQIGGSGGHLRVELSQGREVIENPESASVGRGQKVAPVNGEVAHGRGRQVELDGLPVVAAVERDIHAVVRARVGQTFARGVFAHDVCDAAFGQPGDDLLPRLAAVPRAIDVRV